MSHAASSGYGSARSNNNRTVADVAEETGETPLNPSHLQPQGRMRNSLLNSLRQSKFADSSLLFRSLRIPRADTLPTTPSSIDVPCSLDPTVAACSPADNANLQDNSCLPVATNEPSAGQEKGHSTVHPIPVPAPRFQTLKRHAYQNIPLPLHKKSVEQQQAHIIQVLYILMTQNPPKISN